MRSARPDPYSPPLRILAWLGLAALAALTLVDRGATRMWSAPWTCALTVVLAIPPLLLLARAATGAAPLRLRGRPTTLFACAVALVPLASAYAGPYRAPSLLLAALPASAGALLLLLHDWLAAAPDRHRAQLELALTVAAALVTLASFGLWAADLAALSPAELLSPAVLNGRNNHPLGHANYTAGLALLSLPWLAHAAYRNYGLNRLAAGAAALLALLNLFASGSRGGVLGLAVLGLGAAAQWGGGWRRFLGAATFALVAVGLLAALNPRIRALALPASPGAAPNLSTVQRTAMFEGGLRLGADRPLLGWGPGTTPLAYPRHRAALAGGAENVLQLHSLPVQLWAELGGAGLALLAWAAALLVGGWRRAPLAALALAAYGVFALTDYQLDVPVFAAAVAALLALLAPRDSRPASRLERLGGIAALVLAAALVGVWGRRDPTPPLNVEALTLARDPAQHDRAVGLLRTSLALNPDQELAHFNLGWLLVVPDAPAAEQHFLAAARLVPDKGGVYFGLALARLNQGNRAGAARALALECINEPLFLASPWWNVPEIAALRPATAALYAQLLSALPPTDAWTAGQAAQLATLAPRLGQPSAGPEVNYRRERIGYPVLMRNLDLAPALDIYDVREDPRFPASVPFPLPSKGWLPTPVLLKLLADVPSPAP